MCALLEWEFLFPLFCGIPAIKHCWPSKPDSLRLRPIVRPPGWEKSSTGLRIFTAMQNFCGTHFVGIGFDITVIVLFLSSPCGFFFVFGYKVCFLVGSRNFVVVVVDGC